MLLRQTSQTYHLSMILLLTCAPIFQVPLADNVRMGLSRDFRINQASALANLEVETEVDVDEGMELSSFSELESQSNDDQVESSSDTESDIGDAESVDNSNDSHAVLTSGS